MKLVTEVSLNYCLMQTWRMLTHIFCHFPLIQKQVSLVFLMAMEVILTSLFKTVVIDNISEYQDAPVFD